MHESSRYCMELFLEFGDQPTIKLFIGEKKSTVWMKSGNFITFQPISRKELVFDGMRRSSYDGILPP